MLLKSNAIHVWTAAIAPTEEEALQMRQILSADECKRADKFRFPEHRRRYIAAHYRLRQILGTYTKTDHEKLEFKHTEHKKPFLILPGDANLQFNLSHSGDMAIYAFGLVHPLGIDIERVREECNYDVAERFFSKNEREGLSARTHNDIRLSFYRIWARKEAMIKATGKGMSQSLPAFSVALDDITETVLLDNQSWQL